MSKAMTETAPKEIPDLAALMAAAQAAEAARRAEEEAAVQAEAEARAAQMAEAMAQAEAARVAAEEAEAARVAALLAERLATEAAPVSAIPGTAILAAIGPSFADELRAAGLFGLASWTDHYVNPAEGLTAAQRAALEAVIAAHDPHAGVAVDLLAYARDARWRRETGGIVVQGMPVATDDRSKTLLMGARIAAEKDPTFITPWSTAAGEVALDASQIVAVSDAVLMHVSDCFAAYATVAEGIRDKTIKTPSAIDAVFAAVA